MSMSKHGLIRRIRKRPTLTTAAKLEKPPSTTDYYTISSRLSGTSQIATPTNWRSKRTTGMSSNPTTSSAALRWTYTTSSWNAGKRSSRSAWTKSITIVSEIQRIKRRGNNSSRASILKMISSYSTSSSKIMTPSGWLSGRVESSLGFASICAYCQRA